jgi:carbonic anhydrase/acetyltransferase-like protein (isoleucine patch superfamily)
MELEHLKKEPDIPPSCFIDPSARINGDVVLGEGCSVWFHTAIRGDVHRIRLGHTTNVQDLVVLHTTHQKWPLTIGDEVTFGHGSMAHGCTIGSGVFIGMQSLIMDGAVIGDEVMVGAGSLVTQGKVIPAGVLVMGRPAQIIRELSTQEREGLRQHARKYHAYTQAYAREGKFTRWTDNWCHRGVPQ